MRLTALASALAIGLTAAAPGRLQAQPAPAAGGTPATVATGANPNFNPAAVAPPAVPDASLPAGQVGRVMFRGTPEQVEEIRKLIAENDRLPREVLLETYLLDVNVNRNDNTGLTLQTFFGATRPFSGSPLGAYEFSNQIDAVNQSIKFGSLSTERFQLFLQYLKNMTETRVLNRPSALVMDGGTATLNLGGTVNFLSRVNTTVTLQGTVITSPVTESINTGQNLVMTPRIMPNDIILLNLTLDDTTVSNFQTFGQGTAQVTLPQTRRRALTSPMFLKNGTAVIMGGLKSTTATKESAKIPFLSQLPFIGRNFGRNVKNNSSNELVLIIKATVYSPDDL